MTELFIENQKLDITEELAYLLTFAVDDVKDFASRNCTFSKTIVLPGTAKNNYLFGHIFDATISNPYDPTSDNVSTNFNPSVSATALAFNDRLQVFKGTLRLLDIIIDSGNVEYEIQIVGELGGLVSALGAKKLDDLDFSAYNQNWTAANVTGSWENVTGGGVYFGLIDYGTVSADKVNYDIKAFRPSLYAREYVKKIIEGAGYSWQSNLLNTDRFKSLIIPNNQQRFQNKTDLLLYVYTTTGYLAGWHPGGPSYPQYVAYDTLDTLSSFTANFDQNWFTYTGTDTIIASFNIESTFTYTGADTRLYIRIKKNGTTIYDFDTFTPPTTGSHNFTRQVSDLEISMSTGDVFRLDLEVVTLSGTGNHSLTLDESIWSIRTAYPIWSDVGYNDSLRINDGIPQNVLQRDFLSSIVKLFNLYIYENTLDSRKLFIEPYTDFYDLNVSGVNDWNYKVDRSKVMRFTPMGELNSRYYGFRFKQDSDYYNDRYQKTYNETYGNYTYDSQFEFSNDNTDIDLIFSPSVLVGYPGLDKVVTTIFKLNSGIEENTASNIRILQAKKVTGVSAWSIKNGVTTVLSGLTSYGYCGHYNDPDAPGNDIHFGVPKELYFTLTSGAVNVTQFNVYWSPYLAEITDKDSKLLTCYIKLNSSDIHNLDFSKLVYIDGSYWRINKIEDWNLNEPDICKAELLKVINTFY